NSIGQGIPPNIYANSLRQIQGRQQSSANQEQPQQSQNSQQYLYNQQLQQHIMKQKFQQGGVSQQSIIQSQQQNLMQSNQLQSSQPAVMQSSMRQTSPSSSTLLNQQSSGHSILQQQPQSALRQQPQQQPQASVMQQQQQQQQQSSYQHTMMSSTQQQQQQQNATNIQQNQLIGQQNAIVDAQPQPQQQQRMIAQPNNMSNIQQQQTVSQQSNIPSMHQQQLGPQSNLSGFQQQQMVGNQHANSSLQASQQPVHMLQQSKVPVQQQMHLNNPNALPNQLQQAQSQPMQQQLMSQMQSQPGQLQQQLGLQQQANALSRDMQQRIQTSGPLLQQQTAVDSKQMFQSQRGIAEVPLTSLDSSAQIGNSSGADWQEEVYQKIRYMNEMYFHELNEMYQKMLMRIKMHDTLPQAQKNEQVAKFNNFKFMLERLLSFLKTNKNDVQPLHKEKISEVENHIVLVLSSNRTRKPGSSLQKGQGSVQPQMISVQQPLISQMHATNDGQMNPQAQNVQQANNSVSTASNSRQSVVMDVPQPRSTSDPGQGNQLNQMQQVTMSSLHQNPVSGAQQMNISSMASQTGLATLGPGVNSLQANSNMLQTHQMKQEPQMFTNQQLKQQYQQRHMQQQLMHRQQMIHQQQQQQQLLLQSQQQPPQQITQLGQVTDSNDVKLRNQMGGKPGILQTHSSSQRPAHHNQQMKPGAPFPMSSQQVLHVASPQIGNHASPQIEQQNILQTKPGTLQSASPFVVPSPSTSMAPSPMPGDSEKITAGVSSLSNGANPATFASSMPNQSLAIGTPGISASPLLAEFSCPDGPHGVTCNVVSAPSAAVEQPLDRLIKVVKSMSAKALGASISDISSILSLNDRIAGSAPGNGSRAAIGEDLAAMTKCRLQARNHLNQDGSSSGTKKMRRFTTGLTAGNDLDGESCAKRPRSLEQGGNDALEEELREINERLIDTVVHIDPTGVAAAAAAAAASECREGTIVKCSFSGVALGPILKSQFGSSQTSPIQPLRLLVPKDYPNSSPILLDKLPMEEEELSVKAKSRLSVSLRSLSQPMSVADIASTWEKCARGVLSDYAQLRGGGTFTSKYGSWDYCCHTA
ncbi:hypothetical protein M569_08735, partial [Genlisea aurea]